MYKDASDAIDNSFSVLPNVGGEFVVISDLQINGFKKSIRKKEEKFQA